MCHAKLHQKAGGSRREAEALFQGADDLALTCQGPGMGEKI